MDFSSGFSSLKTSTHETGLLCTMMFAGKLHDWSKSWTSTLFTQDYGAASTSYLLVLRFAVCADAVFAVSVYVITTVEALIKIRLLRLSA